MAFAGAFFDAGLFEPAFFAVAFFLTAVFFFAVRGGGVGMVMPGMFMGIDWATAGSPAATNASAFPTSSAEANFTGAP